MGAVYIYFLDEGLIFTARPLFACNAELQTLQSAVLATAIPSVRLSICPLSHAGSLVPYPDE